MNLKKMPNWLRWILFFPAAIVALAVVYPIVQIGNLLFSPVGQDLLTQLFSVIMGAGVSGFAFVWSGAVIAPRYQFMVAIIMTTIYGLLVGMMLLAKIMLSHVVTTSWFEVISVVIAGSVGAIIACFSFKEAASEKPVDNN